MCCDNVQLVYVKYMSVLFCSNFRLENYGQSDGILFCKKHYNAVVVAKNTQTPTL